MTDLDRLRAENPDLGFAVYAYKPGEPVTLEIHDALGLYKFEGATLAEAIGKAFGPGDTKPAEAVPADVFA